MPSVVSLDVADIPVSHKAFMQLKVRSRHNFGLRNSHCQIDGNRS